jgi:hypothetical protein
MDKREQAIENTITQWTKLAETGEDKPELKDVDCGCYLCQYSYEITGCTGAPSKCKPCPYHKKYGRCFHREGAPYSEWYNCKTKAEKRIHAKAFLEQVKTLRSPKMDKKQELEHKLEQAKRDKEVTNNVIDCQIETLEAQLAEAKKPVKLRHGDYGYWYPQDTKTPFLYHKSDSSNAMCSDPNADWVMCDSYNYVRLGNIFKLINEKENEKNRN